MSESTDGQVIALFDGIASRWETNYNSPYFLDRLRVYERWLAGRLRVASYATNLQALDIGCGTFPAASIFERMGVSAVGVDVSKGMIEEANRCNRNVRLIDGVSLPFEDGTFSFITMINAFEFVSRPRDLFNEIRRVSTPDVAILMTMNNFNSPLKRLLRLRFGASFGRQKEWHSSYTVSSLTNFLASVGFASPSVYDYSLSTLYSFVPSVCQWRVFRNRYFADNIYFDIELHREYRVRCVSSTEKPDRIQR